MGRTRDSPSPSFQRKLEPILILTWPDASAIPRMWEREALQHALTAGTRRSGWVPAFAGM